MKPLEQQTYYELLELPVTATVEQIRAAHERMVRHYGEESVVAYGLIEAEETARLRTLLDEALGVLSDEARRLAYDRGLGLPVRPPAPAVEDSPEPAQLSMLALLEPVEAAPPPAPRQSISYVPHAPDPPPLEASTLEASSPELAARPHQTSAPAASGSNESAASEAAERWRMPPPATPPVRLSVREVDAGAEIAPEVAIGLAETALARVSARVRERPPPEPRPRPVEVPPDAEFNGQLLRQIRKGRGLTLEKLAERTRIMLRHLENVEADRYDALPPPVYLRGILMSLARELGLDPLRVAKSYLSIREAKK